MKGWGQGLPVAPPWLLRSAWDSRIWGLSRNSVLEPTRPCPRERSGYYVNSVLLGVSGGISRVLNQAVLMRIGMFLIWNVHSLELSQFRMVLMS